MPMERVLQLKGVQVNKITQQEFDLRVDAGNITPSMIEQQLYMDYDFTMEVQKNCENLKPVAMSGSYNDLTDKPEFEPTIVNNTLTSQSIDEALSAFQGTVLDSKIAETNIKVNGVENKVISINNDITSINSNLTTIDNRVTEVQNSIPVLGTKKYLHRIRLSIVSSDRKKSAQLFCDYYSDKAEAYTEVAFTTMTSHTDSIPVTGNINQLIGNSFESTYAYQLSILNFNGGYAFIMNGNIEIDTYSSYKDDWTITDNVVGYIFA